MVFGELLGGLANRAGQRFYENAQRQHNEELYKQQIQAEYLINDLRNNWDYLDEQGRAARYGALEPLLGMKPGQLGQMSTFASKLYDILPPTPTQGVAPATVQRAEPQTATVGPLQPGVTGSSPVTGKILSMPETSGAPQISQLPTPAETVPGTVPWQGPSLSRPREIELSQVPAIRKMQLNQAAAEAQQAQKLRQIELSDLPPEYKEMAKAQALGLNVTGYEAAALRETGRARTEAEKLAQKERLTGKLETYRVPGATPETSSVVAYRNVGGRLFDPKTNQQVFLPKNAVPAKEDYIATTDDEGNVHIIQRQAAVGPGNYQAVIPGAGKKTQPKSMGGSNANSSRDFKDKMALRKDFENHPITKQADETARQVKMASSALASGSKNYVAIDQALINVLNKMIDPNSVVREGEYARTIDNTPLLNRIKGKIATIQAGGAGLTNEERTALLEISKRFAADSQIAFNTRANEFRRMAKDQGWNPNDVVVPRAASTNAPPASPEETKKQLIEYLKQKKQQLGGR